MGSNLGVGLKILQEAWQKIGQTAGIETISVSLPYLSEPVGMASSNWFTNAVGELQTNLEPLILLEHLMAIEASFGRKRDIHVQGYQDRTLDLDIIYFGKAVIESQKLMLPHPHLAERLFVLEPLAEIAPGFLDPMDGLTALQKRVNLQKLMDTGLLPLQEIHQAEWPV